LAFVARWISMKPLRLADMAPEIDEKMFVIKYELSYMSR